MKIDQSLTKPLTKADVKAAIAKQRADLPHLYGQKHYLWSRQFVESTNKMNLLCAANQIGKSTSAIKKNIEWACNKKLWPKLWSTPPRIFWYFYPSDRVASVEVEKKWIPDYLPRDEMKNHPMYGWRVQYGREVEAIHFNSGVTIYFKSYAQKIINLQSSTIHMITADEEMPQELLDELLARLTNTKGYFNQVFTATLGLPIWYQAMECIGQPEEKFKSAFKQNVSLYDCRYYEDGSPGPWTDESIKARIETCTSEAEVQKRVFGRFVKDEGRKFASFSPDKHIKQNPPVPGDWRYYAGVDVGSGGTSSGNTKRSSGAVVFLAVDPTFTKARVVKTWRGDGVETSAIDILNIYRRMKQGIQVTNACYDYQSREFGIIASRNGEPFVPADKSRNTGEQIVNSLFRSSALTIDEDVSDNHKLINELMTVPAGDKSRKYPDDLCDALRYTILLVPWDFPKISPDMENIQLDIRDPDTPLATWSNEEWVAFEIRQRRKDARAYAPEEASESDIEHEIAALNEAYGS